MAAALPAIATIAAPFIQKFLSGSGDSGYEKFPIYDKGQQKIHNQLINNTQQIGGMGGGFDKALQNLIAQLDPQSSIHKQFEQPYINEYEQQTIPNLAERFAGMGAQGGALSSSGFGQALSSAGANLQTNLAQMSSNRSQDAMKSLLDLYQKMVQSSLQSSPYAYVNEQKGGGYGGAAQGIANVSPGAWEGLLNSFKSSSDSSSPSASSSYNQDFPLTSYYQKEQLPNFAQKPY